MLCPIFVSGNACCDSFQRLCGQWLSHVLYRCEALPCTWGKNTSYTWAKSMLTDCRSASQKISFLYGTRKFITVFKKARYWTLSSASWIHFAPLIPISLRSILTLPSHLHLHLPSGLFPWSFLIKILYAFLISPMHATCPTISYYFI